MGLPSLYEITGNMLALMEQEEVDDSQIEEAFGQLTEKSNHICHFLADLKGEIDKFKSEEKRLSDRRKAMEAKHDRLREYIKGAMESLGVDTLSAGTFNITLSPTVGSLEIEDEDEIPAEYKTCETVVTVRKDAIKAAIKSGLFVGGATIRPGTSLRIR